MPDLLLELFSEEIPARMQARAADDLRRLVTDRIMAAGLPYEGATAYATPRRLVLTVQGVPARQPDLKEERKGPRVGAPEQAIAGFLKGAGLASIDQAKVQPDKKGDFYVALIEKPGRDAIDVIADIVPEVVRGFPWPKSMRWGAASAESGALNWVRPLHSIIATFGPETEEPDVVRFAVGGIESGDTTRGHRFMAPDAIKIRRFDDYVTKLEAAKVVVDPARRAQIILADAKNLAFAQGFELVEDEGLLAEVAGLVEWPVVLMGTFDEAFLAIPDEVIRATIRNNQKCFVVRDPKTGKLANRFILTANIEATDGGKAIVAGNERVIRARLSDAKFFYDTDLKTRLEDRLPKFEQIVFHEKLGTMAERIARIERLAVELAPLVGADVEKVRSAAKLCKADLLTEVVGEFPEVQGLMGKYYALAQGEDASVAAACEEHYKPVGPNDSVPSDPVSVAVALADKINLLVSFKVLAEDWSSSRDPFGLRRAALGAIRIILSGLNLHLKDVGAKAVGFTVEYSVTLEPSGNTLRLAPTIAGREIGHHAIRAVSRPITDEAKTAALKKYSAEFEESISNSLLSFFADRLKVQLRDQGARHDLVDAVFALGNRSANGDSGQEQAQDDLLLIVRRVEALGKFLDTEDGRNLLAGFKRAANILRIEEKKDGKSYAGAPEAARLEAPEEKALAAAIETAKTDAAKAVAAEDFAAAMTAMAKLRPPVDAFFDKVTVNADDGGLRENRLKLLSEIREATRQVADFSKIEG